MRLENIQPGADVQAQQAAIDASGAGMRAAAANYDAAEATLAQRQADLQKAKFDWERSQELYKDQLIAKSDYDASKATYDAATAGLNAVKAQVEQTRASREQSRFNLDEASAVLKHQKDVLRKTTYVAPIDGIVSYIAVRVGENVVPGIQNAEGSFLMTISDMSIVTAEVKVDETDIVNVSLNQVAEVTIDAMPNRTFHGHVTEIGDTAILRSSGVAASQSNTSDQEAKDFKVVVALDDPPEDIRPGLSCTGKITTATKQHVLTIPIQALTVRKKGDLDPVKKSGAVEAASDPVTEKAKKEELQGVFLVRDGKAQFLQVATGITGATDIEVVGGLKEGDQIITGTYKIIRTLRNLAKVKINNSVATTTQAES
jgi:HlyD family secretion protein